MPELEPEVAFEVGLLLDQFDLLERQIEAADRHVVAGLLDGELARRLQTIPGVGPGDRRDAHRRDRRHRQLHRLRPAPGLRRGPPGRAQLGHEGRRPETSWHMSKAGNSHLRAAAYRMAVVGIQHNPVIAAHYARKRAAGKTKMNALGHCMRKALSIVWGVWRNGQDFDPNWGAEA